MVTNEHNHSSAVSGGAGVITGLAIGFVSGAALCLTLWGIKSFDHPVRHHEYWTAANEGFWIGIGIVTGIAIVNAVSGAADSIKSRVEG